jgi:hypothetical protein
MPVFPSFRHAARLCAACILSVCLLSACNLDLSPTARVSGAPIVAITAPAGDLPYADGVTVYIQARISNAGADIARVEFSVDGAVVATVRDPNPDGLESFTLTHGWTAAGTGERLLSVAAFRDDGTASDAAELRLTIVPGETVAVPTRPPTVAAVMQTPAPPQPTATTAPATVQARTSRIVNVRSGAGTTFPALVSLNAGMTVTVLAVTPDESWARVDFGGGEGWILRELLTIDGSLAGVRREGDAPARAAVTGGANLRFGAIALDPLIPVCNQPFTISVQAINEGDAPTTGEGVLRAVDVRAEDGSAPTQVEVTFPVIAAGGMVRIDAVLNVSTYYNELHRLTLTLDPDDRLSETRPDDNAVQIEYTLDRGACP